MKRAGRLGPLLDRLASMPPSRSFDETDDPTADELAAGLLIEDSAMAGLLHTLAGGGAVDERSASGSVVWWSGRTRMTTWATRRRSMGSIRRTTRSPTTSSGG
jgi:hypothetical protein